MTHSATRVLVWAAALASSLAQSPVLRKQFDVAAVKLTTFTDGHFELRDPVGGNFMATGVTLKMLIMRAYRVHSFQVSGDPDWARTLRWDIRAEAEGVAGRLPIQLMVHRETGPVEILVIDHVEKASEN